MVRHTVLTHLVRQETIAVIHGAPIRLEQLVVVMALRTAEIHSELLEIIGVILGEPTLSVQLGVVTEQPAAQTLSEPCGATKHITNRSSTRPMAAGRP